MKEISYNYLNAITKVKDLQDYVHFSSHGCLEFTNGFIAVRLHNDGIDEDFCMSVADVKLFVKEKAKSYLIPNVSKYSDAYFPDLDQFFLPVENVSEYDDNAPNVTSHFFKNWETVFKCLNAFDKQNDYGKVEIKVHQHFFLVTNNERNFEAVMIGR